MQPGALYLEMAEGTPFKRGVPVTKSELAKKIQLNIPLYRSTYLYNEEGAEYMQTHKSIKGYHGMRYIDYIILDIDKNKNSDKLTINTARKVVTELLDFGINKDDIGIYFSGSGYHIQLSNKIFGFEPSPDLPLIVRSSIKKIFPETDDSILMRTGLYRVQYTLNNKTNLYKIPLQMSVFLFGTPKEIQESAETLDNNTWSFKLEGNNELAHLIDHSIPKTKVYSKKILEPTKVVPCIQNMLSKGPLEGYRHNTILRVASHFRRHGIPSEYCKVVLDHWNNNSLEEGEIINQVESAYNGGYQYGCNDSMMKKHCRPNCIYFKHKDYNIDILTSIDLQKQLETRYSTNFEGRSIDIGKMYELNNKDIVIYPGELVTIFGATGCNKTTIAQNIALGYNAAEDTINQEIIMPTLYLSLELSGWYMHRRNLQILSNTSKEYIEQNYKKVYEEYKDSLAHINIQTIAPTINQIQEKIRELQPNLVIIDYIDLIEPPREARGEYEQIKYISHKLSTLAVNLDLIIIQLSQISRQYSREQVIDLYAGKGSGAIENASRKVLGINGRADSEYKIMELLKNNDGDLFSIDLKWTPSFRMIKQNIKE